ncbi:SGNH/GDSL hydrolase family protein [Paenibacillus taiwanensis]|uniref:SGNH/GDSL hydrolase family protein n=1 Tax=Paenibacillus taiwanensis TaxID=401638 RepID=UPI0003FBEA28|nr:hypothetical protein [Paenibacillus taiwanensis]
MKQQKVWIVWGLTLLIFAMGYVSVQSQAASDSKLENTNLNSADSSNNGAINPKKKANYTESVSINGDDVTIIGDSVIVGVEPYLKEMLPKVTVDGKVGRQMSQARELIKQLSIQQKLGDRIIIELGTNGPFSKDQLRSLLKSLDEAKQVLVVTTRVPKGWQDAVNSNINDVVGDFKNAEVVDWYTASEGKGQYFYKDGVHLTPDGNRFYASLLIQALEEK